jgi:hypothetical protein
VRLELVGTVRVRTTDFASRYVGAVQRELIGALIEQKVGTIREAGTTISYRRGFLPGKSVSITGPLATFDPGEISLATKGTVMLVKYRLNLRYHYGHLALLAFVFACGVVVFDRAGPWFPAALGAFLLIATLWGLVSPLLDVRRWLKATVQAGIRNHALLGRP